MKELLFILILHSCCGNPGTFATDDTQLSKGTYRFAKLEATETSWDYTSLIYHITDASGHTIEVPPSQISYIVSDKGGDIISSGKGIFVSINDTRLQSEEDYTITITAHVKKENISQTIYRKASPKKLMLRQQGNSFAYTLVRPRYSSPGDYEPLRVNASDMSIDVAFAGCKECATLKISNNASHTTLSDEGSYKIFENTIREMTDKGKHIQLILQPTINHKGSSIKYAQSYYEVTPDTVREIPALPATADKDAADN
jgi:hypothetical protein